MPEQEQEQPQIDSITVDGTKYRFVEEPKGGFRIDRYGEPWMSADEVRQLPGIKAFIALFFRAVTLERGHVRSVEQLNHDNTQLFMSYRRMRTWFIASAWATALLLAGLVVSVTSR